MKNLIYLTLFSLVFAACEKIVDVEIPSESPRLVVEGQITNLKELWKVRLTLSQPYFDQEEVDAIADAVVTIKGTDGTDVLLSHTDTGMFVSNDSLQCLVGEEYFLSIIYKGDTYTAKEKLQNAFAIDTLAAFYLPPNDRSFPEGTYIFLQGQSDQANQSFYLFKTYRNDTLKSEDLDDDEFGSVSLLNSAFDVNDILGEIARGSLPRPILFDVDTDDTIRVEQYAITQQYYQFLIDLGAQQGRSGTPFDPPPANPNNNISNGGLGYFSVAHKEEMELVVE